MEDPTITLTLTSKKLDIIANALGMRPYVEVAQLLQDIGQQVQAQQPQKLSASPLDAKANGADAPPQMQ